MGQWGWSTYCFNLGKTMSCLPPMTGNGLNPTDKKMVMAGGWCKYVQMALLYPH